MSDTQSAECLVIDRRLCVLPEVCPIAFSASFFHSETRRYYHVPDFHDPDNAKWKEAWENYNESEIGYKECSPLTPSGKYRLVKRECENCGGRGYFVDVMRHHECPACAKNVEPGYVYTLKMAGGR
jgi:hypothetical protein